MNETLQTISIGQLQAMLPELTKTSIDDEAFVYDTATNADFPDDRILDLIKHPLRLDGFIILFCASGSAKVDINLKSFELTPNTLLVNIPGNIIRIENPAEQISGGRFVIIGLSRDFVSSVHFDFAKMYNESVRLLEDPSMSLDEDQLVIAKEYFNLAMRLLNPEIGNRKEAISSLFSSLLYIAGGIWQKRLTSARDKGTSSIRVKNIFDQFIALVTEHHNKERGMQFYADKLCLSPKYLSKLIKQASGRSAPDWIDAFVILEAKNMLKYSSMPIKTIVYKLNFPNQSVFYKFFKAHTGLTPTDYRNS